MDNTVGSLTQQQRSLIIGTILGDGYLRIFKGRRNALLEINHSFSQKKYVDWKYQILKDVSGSPPQERQGNGQRIAYRFYSKQLPELTSLYRQFYIGSYKRIPDSLSLDPFSLAVWFMDDGSRSRECDVYLNTQQFKEGDQVRLILALKKLGLSARMNRDKIYYRLRFLKKSIPRLHNLISEFVIPEMKYKLVGK